MKNIIIRAFEEIFGEEVVQRTGHHPIHFSVELKFFLDEAKNIFPADSGKFENVDHLDQFLTGSKVAFRRHTCFGKSYLHTGILLRGKEENVILEVNDAGPRDDVTTLHQTPAYRVFQNGSNPPNGPSIEVLNKYLQCKGVDISALLYRYSRIADLPICYSYSEMNCDVIANWLQRATPFWISNTKESELAIIIDWFKSSEDGIVDLATLYNIQSQIKHLEVVSF